MHIHNQKPDLRKKRSSHSYWREVCSGLLGILAGVAYSTSNPSAGSNPASEADSIIVGLLTSSVLLMSSLFWRVLERIEDLLNASEVSDAMMRTPHLLSETRQQLRDEQELNTAAPHSVILKRYRHLKEEFLQRLHVLASGQIRLEENIALQTDIDIVRSSSLELLATSYVDLDSWWETPEGKNYWEINETLAQRITIKRIFIITESERDNPDILKRLCELIKKHLAANIFVRVAIADRLPRNLKCDFLVVDRGIYSETISSRDGKTHEIEIGWKNPRLAEFVRHFETLENYYSHSAKDFLETNDHA